MFAATSRPRSARISTSSISSSMAWSRLRLATRSVIASPMEADVRVSPPLSRCHQLACWRCRSFRGRDSDFSMTAEQIVSRILYRDGLMLVIDKPPGIAVHKGPKDGDSLEDCFGALRFGLLRAPALAHRLDRDTSGCLVLGRHRKALAA